MLLESTLLEKIVTRNVVKVTLEATQLENNFELILKALKSHDGMFKQYQDRFASLEKQVGSLGKAHSESVQSVKEMDKMREKEVKKVSEVVNGHHDKIKKIEVMLEQSKKINPQNLKDENQKDLSSSLSELEAKVSKIQHTLDDYSKHSDEIKQLEEISIKNKQVIQTLGVQLDKIKKTTESLKNAQLKKENNDSSLELAKMRKDVDAWTQQIKHMLTHNQFQKELSQKVDQPFAKMKQSQDELARKIKKLSDQIWKLNDQIYNDEKEGRQKDIDNKHVLDDILKQLADLRSLSDRDRTFSARNTESVRKPQSDFQTQVSPFKQKYETEIKRESQKDNDQADLRKEIIEKLKQQKGDFTKAIKKLDLITHRKDEEQKQKVSRLQDRIHKLQFLMECKVDQDNLKKWMKYIENKIGYLYRIVNVDQTEQDAIIGRKNWFCLSCDKKLQGYRGKVGSHLTGAQLRGKTIDADIVGGGMLFKNKSRIELPQFKK